MGRFQRYLSSGLIYTFLTAITFIDILLYIYLFIASFSSNIVGLIPKGFSLGPWKMILSGDITVPGAGVTYHYPNLYLVLANTLILALTIAGGEAFFSSLAGYALSRFRFRGRSQLLGLVLVLHSFPGVALLVGVFFLLNTLGLYDSLVGVIIMLLALNLPLSTWIMKGFFDSVPWDIEMSALIDGCNRFQTWWKVLLPSVKNGIMAVIIFGFLAGWSEFIYILTFISSQKYWTMSMLVYALTTGEYFVINPSVTAAVAIVYMIPVIIFFLVAQKYLLRLQLVSKGVT